MGLDHLTMNTSQNIDNADFALPVMKLNLKQSVRVHDIFRLLVQVDDITAVILDSTSGDFFVVFPTEQDFQKGLQELEKK